MSRFCGFFWVVMMLPLTSSAQELKLWYTSPAGQWEEALPIGNGHMGAMIFGGVVNERIQFNQDTLWTGQPHDYVRQGARDHLEEIRRLIFQGRSAQAVPIVLRHFLSDPIRQKAYQPFGDLHLYFAGHDNATDYRRELDLDSALASVSYQVGGVSYRRELFASYPDNVIVMRLSAAQPARISFTLKMDSPHRLSRSRAVWPDTLALTGQVQDPTAGNQLGLRFESRLQIRAAGGRLSLSDDGITVENADSVTLLLVAATSFENFQQINADPAQRCLQYLEKLAGKSYEALRADHLADYQKLFGSVKLDLGRSDGANLSTDRRLKQVQQSGLLGDPSFAALYFQWGRYLLIASSRPGSQPANLQGVWNELLDPPWESKYTTNVNFEMNYWPAELTNLSQCHQPLFDLVDDLRISGARTAKQQYGARGWVLHHNTDLWRGTAPINNIEGVWPTGAAWMCHHLWEHYLFSGDREFLARRAYPAMKEASLFFVDFLVKDPRTGWLVTNPSHSPEQGPLCAGPAMDMQLIRALFDYTMEAADILGIDRDFARQLADLSKQLAPDQIGRHGQLQEWLEDIDVPDNDHRHMSPLWGLYPGFQFTPDNPRLFDAARVLLKWRGDGSTGWSYAWRMALWARAYDGDFAWRQLELQLTKKTFPNLFDKCGPFQVDGNFGATAAIAEMLLQSHLRLPDSRTHQIDLLPALPRAWPDGSVSGLCARGGFEVDMSWQAGRLTRVAVRSKLGNPCRIRYGSHAVDLATAAGGQYVFDGQLRDSK